MEIDKAKDFHRRQYAGADFERHRAIATEGLREHEQPLVARFFPNTAAAVLEIGTGCGRIAFGLECGGYKNVVATDFVDEFVAEARRLARERQSVIRFFPADATRLPFEDGAFDYVVALGVVISHLPFPEQHERAFKEIARVLKPTGTALVSVKNLHWDSWHMTPLRLATKIARHLSNPYGYPASALPRVGIAGKVDWGFLGADKPQLYYFEPLEFSQSLRRAGFGAPIMLDERSIAGSSSGALHGHTLFAAADRARISLE